MRWLKIVTTGLLVAGLGLLIAWPWIVGPRPVGAAKTEAERKELARYGLKALSYFAVTTSAFLGAAAGAVLIIRRTRREFVDHEKQIVRGLVEGSLKDHERS